jgi:hypothetical protein
MMTRLAILISPLAKGAYFADFIAVAKAELSWVAGINESEHLKIGEMEFLLVDANVSALSVLSRLSFVLGIFEVINENFSPLPADRKFSLHSDFVFGSKYKGKTNETLTQLLINVGLASIDHEDGQTLKLLDPMCGRGTTLLWAMRYGINSKGLEQDPKSVAEFRSSVKKWCKLHHQKHRLSDGFIGPANKQSLGKFYNVEINANSMRAVTGSSQDASQYFKAEKFNLIVSDLPYGIQYLTPKKTRNPLDVIADCAQAWVNCLRKDGVLVLAFNSYMPKRSELTSLFIEQGLIDLNFSASHRMSESIVRDVLVMKK